MVYYRQIKANSYAQYHIVMESKFIKWANFHMFRLVTLKDNQKPWMDLKIVRYKEKIEKQKIFLGKTRSIKSHLEKKFF